MRPRTATARPRRPTARFAEPTAQAADAGHGLLVVTLDPPPVARLRGGRVHPTFEDVAARLAVQARCGARTRIVVSLTRDEVDASGAADLLQALAEHVTI